MPQCPCRPAKPSDEFSVIGSEKFGFATWNNIKMTFDYVVNVTDDVDNNAVADIFTIFLNVIALISCTLATLLALYKSVTSIILFQRAENRPQASSLHHRRPNLYLTLIKAINIINIQYPIITCLYNIIIIIYNILHLTTLYRAGNSYIIDILIFISINLFILALSHSIYNSIITAVKLSKGSIISIDAIKHINKRLYFINFIRILNIFTWCLPIILHYQQSTNNVYIICILLLLLAPIPYTVLALIGYLELKISAKSLIIPSQSMALLPTSPSHQQLKQQEVHQHKPSMIQVVTHATTAVVTTNTNTTTTTSPTAASTSATVVAFSTSPKQSMTKPFSSSNGLSDAQVNERESNIRLMDNAANVILYMLLCNILLHIILLISWCSTSSAYIMQYWIFIWQIYFAWVIILRLLVIPSSLKNRIENKPLMTTQIVSSRDKPSSDN